MATSSESMRFPRIRQAAGLSGDRDWEVDVEVGTVC